ncbi:MAG: type I-E CRISPR-associated protein Cse2/CasB [Syntrophorhabdales bacterium]
MQIRDIFKSGDSSSALVVKWWENLKNDRGSRAELKRISDPGDPLQIAHCRAYHRLYWDLTKLGYQVNVNRIAPVTAILSHVDTHDRSTHVAARMGQPKPGKDKPMVSELRFKLLLSTKDMTAAYKLLMSAVSLIANEADVVTLAKGVYWWLSDITYREWFQAYYSAALK